MLKRTLLVFSFSALIFTKILAQETRITAQLPAELTEVQLLVYQTPFDENVQKLMDIETTNGHFDVSFPLKNQTYIIIQSGDHSANLLVKPGVHYEVKYISRNIKNRFYFLSLVDLKSNDPVTNYLYGIEKHINELGNQNKKKKKLSKKYPSLLYHFLLDKIDSIENNKLQLSDFSNSEIYSSSIFRLKLMNSKENLGVLDSIYSKNLTYSFTSLKKANSAYAADIFLSFLYQKKEKDYFNFIDLELANIKSEKLRDAVELSLLASAYGRKSNNPETTKKRMQQFVETKTDTILVAYAKEVQALHETGLINTRLQNFELTNLDGKTINLKDYEGKYLLIDFWATYCGPCVKSMKKLPTLKEELSTELSILCISTEANQDKVAKFVKRNGYKNILDFGYPSNIKEIESYFDQRAIPLYYLVDPNGIIIGKAISDPTAMIKEHLK